MTGHEQRDDVVADLDVGQRLARVVGRPHQLREHVGPLARIAATLRNHARREIIQHRESSSNGTMTRKRHPERDRHRPRTDLEQRARDRRRGVADAARVVSEVRAEERDAGNTQRQRGDLGVPVDRLAACLADLPRVEHLACRRHERRQVDGNRIVSSAAAE